MAFEITPPEVISDRAVYSFWNFGLLSSQFQLFYSSSQRLHLNVSFAALPKPLPVAGRRGETTADLLDGPALSNAKTKSILDLIADPARSHFFNTDCVSCHTETRLRMDKLHVVSIAGIDQSVLPNGPWDVRNFGWAPPGKAAPAGTVAERTATETAAVVKFINAGLLPKK